MMQTDALLTTQHLSVITQQADAELTRIQNIIENKVLVGGRVDLEELLGRLLEARDAGAPCTPKTLDLIGHSTAGKSLLMLGDWVIDASSSRVTAFFRELADVEVLPRLGVHAVRLLGCDTAESEQGRATICALASLLGLEVHGTTELLYSAHYDARGFRDDCTHVLVAASDLRGAREPRAARGSSPTYPRTLDLDALPARPLAPHAHAWPRRLADIDATRALLRLVRRTDGAHMPGLLAQPHCELAIPSARPGHCHVAQVILGGEFIRVYPDGTDAPGVLYPAVDASALRQLVDALPVG